MSLMSYKLAGIRAGNNWDNIIPTLETKNQVITTSLVIHNYSNNLANINIRIKNGGNDYPILKTRVEAGQTLFIAENIILLQDDSLQINGSVTEVCVVLSADKSVNKWGEICRF